MIEAKISREAETQQGVSGGERHKLNQERQLTGEGHEEVPESALTVPEQGQPAVTRIAFRSWPTCQEEQEAAAVWPEAAGKGGVRRRRQRVGLEEEPSRGSQV